MNWKATLSSVVFLVLAAWTMPAFAEVQNVKVGGDVTVRAFMRENLDARAGDGTFDEHEDFMMSTFGLNVGADLTENVGVFLRLVNERDWNAQGTTAGTSQDVDDIGLSQGYVTLKELFYSPLTLRLGTQPIVWGRGFVLGSNLLPSIVGNAGDRNTAITADEYTDYTAFDAIRATLDLSNIGGMTLPLNADFVYIKQDENAIGLTDDVTIAGVNLGTKFDTMAAEAETYYLLRRDQSNVGGAATATVDDYDLHTIGIRGSLQPVEGSSVWAEVAYQGGDQRLDPEGIVGTGSQVAAWALNLGGNFTLRDVAMTPTIGAEWRFYSGRDLDVPGTGWNPIAPGYFTTAIREFQQRAGQGGFYPVDQTGVTNGQTNQHELGVFGALKPLEDLNVSSRLSWFFMAEGQRGTVAGSQDRNKFVGTEWDTQVKYDYTDDVQFGVLYALFLPGSTFGDDGSAAGNQGDNTAQQLVTTVSVKF